MMSFHLAAGDLLTSFPCLSKVMLTYFSKAWAPDTRWQPAAACIGDPDSQMTVGRNGGWWVYPSKFDTLPTPPGATDKKGKLLPSNVKAGESGSRVVFWAHGSAFAVLQAKDWVWLVGQKLVQQTGQVLLVGEYGLSSSVVFPAQLNAWKARHPVTRTTLCRSDASPV
jgi:hypothetical protein